jgi:heat shock protein HslJ
MIKNSNYFLLGLTMLLVFQACSLLPNTDLKLLEGTDWELVSIRKSAPIASITITIAFSNGEVHGRSGCNTFFGSYQINGQKISFGPMAMTEMACLEPDGVMQQELDYLGLLSEANTFDIVNEQLILSKDAQNQLVYESQQE